MSRENVEIVRRVYDQHALHGVEGLLEFVRPDIEISESPQFPDTGTYRGQDGLRGLHGLFTEQFDPFEMRLEEVIDAGDNAVACLAVGGVARQSGMEVFIPSFHVLTLRDGKVERMQIFLGREEALAAVGLSE
jgi:ketosteroid isomerase-like protein